MNNITIYNKTKNDLSLYEEILINVFNDNNIKASFSIIFVSKKEIKHLNKQFRNINKITDVLSFTNDEQDGYLGDIFICLKKAIKQAKTYEHSLEREISFLAVHGYLHLIGYDHQTKEEEKEMILKQEEILNKANIKRNKL